MSGTPVMGILEGWVHWSFFFHHPMGWVLRPNEDLSEEDPSEVLHGAWDGSRPAAESFPSPSGILKLCFNIPMYRSCSL